MAHIDALIDKISDPDLREALREQVDTLLGKQSFGLVFQEHKPETVELHDYRVTRGCKVRRRGEGPELHKVKTVKAGVAEVLSLTGPEIRQQVPVEELVVVREFGEPVYPGLQSVGRLDEDPAKPFHTVINAENYHALEMLLYTSEDKVDAIYIDPPYNTGARDWKYNNDYVDGVDQYRHSKWLAFMERRLALAKRLLKAESSVLVVTIDEKEVHHLGMLLERMFPDAVRQMVTIVINPLGQARKQELARVEEYAFFVFIGDAQPNAVPDDLLSTATAKKSGSVRWEWLLRGGTGAARRARPNLFYPIFLHPESGQIVSAGPALPADADRNDVTVPEGLRVLWPLRENGDEVRWRCSPEYLMALVSQGYAKLGAYDKKNDRWSVLYLGKAQIKRIASGELQVVGHDARGAVQLEGDQDVTRTVTAKTVWSRMSHRGGEYGGGLVRTMLPGRDFPCPKSLYSVEDTLRIAVGNKPDALVLDFFAGSGTTAHALFRLNAEDNGRRRSILVTNNEVSADDAADLAARGLRPGLPEWDERGIFHHITAPRVRAAVTGMTPDGRKLPGSYLDGTLMADGLPENVEFFQLTYENPDVVSRGLAFEAISPLLWLKAGARGARIDKVEADWSAPDDAHYGVLFDVNKWRGFVDALKERTDVTHVFIVTESESSFRQIIAELPTHIDPTQLYEDYLRSFQLNTKGVV